MSRRPPPDTVSFATVAELSARLRSGELDPVTLATHVCDRLEQLGPKYGAVVTVTRERAMREAQAAKAELAQGRWRGPLHGVPYGVKDLLATGGGVPTTWGAKPFAGQTFEKDATVVRKLADAGAVLCGKLAMIELAGGMGYDTPDASLTGPCRNPWSPDAWSGGSSSGPGAAVAAGLVPFAIGSETLGSIVCPSAFCGVSGLRPTYGRVSRHGAMALSWSMDKLGPMARTAEDCALVLSVIAGEDPDDPSASSRSWSPNLPSPPFRLAVPKDATEGVDPAVASAFEASLGVLKGLGCTIEEVDFPQQPWMPVARTILGAEAAAAFDDFLASGGASGLRAPEDRWGGFAYDAILAKDYLNALRLRKKLVRALDAWMKPYDAVLTPAMPFVALPIDGKLSDAFGEAHPHAMEAAGNVAGTPCVVVPNGFGDRGLPTAIKIDGRAWDENVVLAVAIALQGATDWHTRRPKIDAGAGK